MENGSRSTQANRKALEQATSDPFKELLQEALDVILHDKVQRDESLTAKQVRNQIRDLYTGYTPDPVRVMALADRVKVESEEGALGDFIGEDALEILQGDKEEALEVQRKEAMAEEQRQQKELRRQQVKKRVTSLAGKTILVAGVGTLAFTGVKAGINALFSSESSESSFPSSYSDRSVSDQEYRRMIREMDEGEHPEYDYNDEEEIQDMEVGEKGYTVPWGIYFDKRHQRHYLNKSYPVGSEVGTADTLVERTKKGYNVTIPVSSYENKVYSDRRGVYEEDYPPVNLNDYTPVKIKINHNDYPFEKE